MLEPRVLEQVVEHLLQCEIMVYNYVRVLENLYFHTLCITNSKEVSRGTGTEPLTAAGSKTEVTASAIVIAARASSIVTV